MIQDLDHKKAETIKETYRQVSANLGEIFSSLLPGATACLSIHEGHTVENGLELKVEFNGIEKQNLSELSGGQRSLLALSFVLSMLKYKPAPLYILDEIDAALDLSHT